MRRVVEVVYTDEFEKWWDDLAEDEQDDVAQVVMLLAERGVALGHPHSSSIASSTLGALRELRIQSGGRPLRVFYIFDPKRQAVLLVGGDKTGNARFYEQMIRKAEKVYGEYLQEMDRKDE